MGEERVSRRALLIGGAGGAVAVAGGVAVGDVGGLRSTVQRWLDGCDATPAAPPPSHWPRTIGVLDSRAAHARVPYVIARPPPVTRPAGVCVCLPGRNSSAASILDDLHAQDVAALVTRRLGVPPFAIAAIGGGNSYWHPRRDGSDRLAMLLDEFLPLLARQGLGGRGHPRAILGISMGGYGALLAAAHRPRAFAAAVASSPAVWRSAAEQEAAVPDAFDGAREWATNNVFALAPRLDGRKIRIDVGSSDPFAPAVRRLIASFTPRPAGGVGSGCHHVGFWAKVLPAQLAFVAEAFRAARP